MGKTGGAGILPAKARSPVEGVIQCGRSSLAERPATGVSAEGRQDAGGPAKPYEGE
jgi:hypothetical protein